MREAGKTEAGLPEFSENFDLEPPVSKKVILLNDDFTTKDFVVAVLMYIFHKNKDEAYTIMEKVHCEGRGFVGEYTYDIAATKCMQVKQAARKNGFPLRCVME